uniref:(northern house mosquito) hypothetical protein n=1 Tax=Culex pipiens TaxID=7175 RepID=A0A8D8PC06_CULPI
MFRGRWRAVLEYSRVVVLDVVLLVLDVLEDVSFAIIQHIRARIPVHVLPVLARVLIPQIVPIIVTTSAVLRAPRVPSALATNLLLVLARSRFVRNEPMLNVNVIRFGILQNIFMERNPLLRGLICRRNHFLRPPPVHDVLRVERRTGARHHLVRHLADGLLNLLDGGHRHNLFLLPLLNVNLDKLPEVFLLHRTVQGHFVIVLQLGKVKPTGAGDHRLVQPATGLRIQQLDAGIAGSRVVQQAGHATRHDGRGCCPHRAHILQQFVTTGHCTVVIVVVAVSSKVFRVFRIQNGHLHPEQSGKLPKSHPTAQKWPVFHGLAKIEKVSIFPHFRSRNTTAFLPSLCFESTDLSL